jgi:hypothetical protein
LHGSAASAPTWPVPTASVRAPTRPTATARSTGAQRAAFWGDLVVDGVKTRPKGIERSRSMLMQAAPRYAAVRCIVGFRVLLHASPDPIHCHSTAGMLRRRCWRCGRWAQRLISATETMRYILKCVPFPRLQGHRDDGSGGAAAGTCHQPAPRELDGAAQAAGHQGHR